MEQHKYGGGGGAQLPAATIHGHSQQLQMHQQMQQQQQQQQQQALAYLDGAQSQPQQQQQALRVIRRRILDLDLTVAKTLSDVAERRQISDELSANDVHAIVNTFDNVVADYFSPERWRPLRDAMGSAGWPQSEWQLALQRVDQAILGIAERRRAIRRSDLLFEKIVLDELGLRCHLIRRALGGEAGGAGELIEEIQYYRQIQRSDRGCHAGQAATGATAAGGQQGRGGAGGQLQAAAASAGVRFNAKVNVKEFKARQ